MPFKHTPEQVEIILSAKGTKDLKTLARLTGMTECAVYAFCYKRKIPIKKQQRGRGDRKCNIVNVVPKSKEKSRIPRHPAVYTNHSPFGIAS